MICGLCGTDIKPGFLTCPGCQATYGTMLTPGGIALFVPAFLLLFVGFKALTIGILCLAAAVWILWTIFKKSPRGWRKEQSY
jgi:hypothetical protein